MRTLTSLGCLAGLILGGPLALSVRAEAKPVTILRKWKGSVEDEALQKLAPECITSAKALEKLWRAWKVEDKMPDIDFTKQAVIVITASGSKLDLTARLHEDGNLEVIGYGTSDLVPGFRYLIAIVSLDGVKKVNKKALPPS